MKPVGKVSAAAAGGAAATVAVYVAGLFGVEVPGEVAAAAATLLGFVFGWLTPSK